MSQTVYDFYVHKKPTKIGRWIAERVAHRIFDWGRKHVVKPRPRIVEIGPGHGEFVRVCLAHDCRITALEMNPKLCAELKTLGADVIRASCPPLPCGAETADWIHASHVLEHMRTPDEARELVAEMSRVARPDGIISLAYPDFGTYARHFWNCDYSHAFPTSPRRVAQIAADVGLVQIDLRPISGFVSFGPLRIVSNILCHVYDHSLLGRLLDGAASAGGHPELFYKSRTSLTQTFMSIFEKSRYGGLLRDVSQQPMLSGTTNGDRG